MNTDVIIVGAGLAGSCAALYLSQTFRVWVVDAEGPAAGASGAAAGLVNPMMGRRARLVETAPEALDAVAAAVALAGAEATYRQVPIVRPARDAKQAARFQEAGQRHPAYAAWMPTELLQEQHPAVLAPHGALVVRGGGAMQVPAFVEAVLAASEAQGARLVFGKRVMAWGEEEGRAWVDLAETSPSGEPSTSYRISAGHVVLALGWGFRSFDDLAGLKLHGVKGQTIQVRPAEPVPTLPVLSGHGYVVPDGAVWTVGSTYEHDFDDTEPTTAAAAQLLQKAARMVPAVAGATVTAAQAGVRITLPGGPRLPLVGPVPGYQRCWTFTGLGSKGVLMAPLLAAALPRYLHDPRQIPAGYRPGGA